MNRRSFLTAAGVAPLLQAAPQQFDGSGLFAPLFDGKSLNGWSVQDGPETA